eukprot:TRINITY_DN26517_c0_g1_i2.p1 TRINITY_DN26517_c0_g1~~TRINITY_DN26517_c0_g1_i2.p1  ORF type:complete len:1483 (+),score=380.93 TRINITY_DN26517_c0_g1_i2:63-4451(+)
MPRGGAWLLRPLAALLWVVAPSSTQRQQYWCSSTFNYTALANPCQRLPCDGTDLGGPSCRGSPAPSIGARVIKQGTGSPPDNTKGTVICRGSAGGTLLVLWDDFPDVDDQWDRACGGYDGCSAIQWCDAGLCADHAALRADWLVNHTPQLGIQRQGHTWWVACSDVHLLCPVQTTRIPIAADPECADMLPPHAAATGTPAPPPQNLSAAGYGTVIAPAGVVVTSTIDPLSTAVATLPPGTRVYADMVNGTRARITDPTNGWISINDATGTLVAAAAASPQAQALNVSVAWADMSSDSPRRYPPLLAGCASDQVPASGFSVRRDAPFLTLAVQVIHTELIATTNDSRAVAAAPQLRCTMWGENVTLFGTTTVLTASGCAVFNDVTVGSSPHMDVDGKIRVHVRCSPVALAVGAVLHVDSVASGYIVVRNETASPTAAPPVEELPPSSNWGAGAVSSGTCGWRGGASPSGWYWVCNVPPPPPLDSGHAPVQSPIDLPPAGAWGWIDNCDRPVGPAGSSPCRFDCLLSPWGTWSDCSEQCGTAGTRTRSRAVVETERYGGTPCRNFDLQESAPCNRHGCATLCSQVVRGVGSSAGSDTPLSGAAGPGGACSAPFATVRTDQMYLQGATTPRPSYFEDCAALQAGVLSEAVFLFEGHNVSVDVSDSVQITVKGASVGSSCNLIYQRPCVRIMVYIGKFGAGPWEHCGPLDHTDNDGIEYNGGASGSVRCGVPFSTRRFFVRLVPQAVAAPGTEGAGAITGGQDWAHGAEQRAVDMRPDGTRFGGTFGSAQYAIVFIQELTVDLPCVRDCLLSDWGPWGVCSAPCGGGWHTRERVVLTDPTASGRACGETVQRRECNDHSCSQDCRVTPWSNWSACSVNCGGGEQVSTRSIQQSAAGSGTPCPTNLVRRRVCNTDSCGSDCQVSAWSTFSACTVSCGGGFRRRQRTVLRPPALGGDPCPALEATEPCNLDPCSAPVEIVMPPVGGPPPPDPPQLAPLDKHLVRRAPAEPPADAPRYPPSPADGLPLYDIGVLPRPVADGSGDSPSVTSIGSPVEAFVAALGPAGVGAMRELANGTAAFVSAALVDPFGSPPAAGPLRIQGDTLVPLTSAGTAAFTDLTVVGTVTGETLVDIALAVELVSPGDVVEVRMPGSSVWERGSVAAAAPALRIVSAATARPLEGWAEVRPCCAGDPATADPARVPAVVRRVALSPPAPGPAPAPLLYSHWGVPVDAFSATSWRQVVAAAAGVTGDQVDLLAVQPAYASVPLIGSSAPIGACLSYRGAQGQPAAQAAGQGTAVIFRFTSQDPHLATQKFLRAALDPTALLGQPRPPLCGVAEAFAAPSSDPRLAPYLERSLRSPVPTPQPTPVPTPAPATVDWVTFHAVLWPSLLVIWGLTGVVLYCLWRRRGRTDEPPRRGASQHALAPNGAAQWDEPPTPPSPGPRRAGQRPGNPIVATFPPRLYEPQPIA